VTGASEKQRKHKSKFGLPNPQAKNKRRTFMKLFSRAILIAGGAILASTFVAPSARAAHDPCAVLTAESFSKIMGYAATIDKTGSNQMHCFYNGPQSGGQFSILIEDAEGPQADAFLNRRGSSPPAGSGLIGGTYKEGKIIFSISIRSTDQDKLQALVAEVRRNLK
jgi:hypothetical protein